MNKPRPRGANCVRLGLLSRSPIPPPFVSSYLQGNQVDIVKHVLFVGEQHETNQTSPSYFRICLVEYSGRIFSEPPFDTA